MRTRPLPVADAHVLPQQRWRARVLSPRRRRFPPPLLVLAALVVALVAAMPLVYLVVRASERPGDLFDLLWRDRTVMLLRHSLTLMATVTLGSLLLALPLAWLTTRTDLPGRRFWWVASTLPLVVPSYVGGFAIIATLGPRGSLQGLLEPFGVQRLPDIYGWFGASLALTLFTFPYVLLPVRSALASLDASLEDAARSLGMSAWSTFWRVTLPQLRPSAAAGSLLVAFYVLSDFGAVSLMRYDTFTMGIYNQYRSAFDRTLAAGLSLVLVSLTIIVLLLEAWTRKRTRYHRSTGGVSRPPRKVALGRWRWVATAWCGVVVSCSLLIPVGVVTYWMLRGVRDHEPLMQVLETGLRTAGVSLAAALIAVLAAAPVVVLSVRFPGWLASVIERLTWAGYGLPGIVIALSLVFFGLRVVPSLYQTLAMLVLAYVIRFLPQAVGALRASFLQMNPHLEDAARSLGYRTPRIWARVVLPILSSGVISAATLVFLTCMKELPATMLLRPTGFDTLATRIWSASSEGFWARAAAPSMMLIVLSAIPLLVVAMREELP